MSKIKLLLLLVSNFTLQRNINAESYNDLVDETTDTAESEVKIKKNRDPPRQKEKSGNKEWKDDESFVLIYAWSSIEQLFNAKHPKYHLRVEKMKLLPKIKDILHEKGIEVIVKQKTDKTHSLRNYYSAERRKE